MEHAKKRAYTKRRLIKELAFRSGISQIRAREALEAIIEIAYREAKANCFVLPGLCKFDVVRRRARNVRNPITGEILVLPERDALHVVLSKRAKEAVAPRVAPLKPEEYAALLASKAPPAPPPAAEPPAEVAPEAPQPAAAPPPEIAPEAPPAPPSAAEPSVEVPVAAPPPAAQGEMSGAAQSEESGDEISFFCTTCEQEIIAPREAVGVEAECPTCGAILTVPAVSEPGSLYAANTPGAVPEKEIITSDEVENLDPQALKNRTIRIDTMLFAGEEANAPVVDARMAAARKSRTMRIDLPDEF